MLSVGGGSFLLIILLFSVFVLSRTIKYKKDNQNELKTQHNEPQNKQEKQFSSEYVNEGYATQTEIIETEKIGSTTQHISFDVTSIQFRNELENSFIETLRI
jgi:hypothetical protein